MFHETIMFPSLIYLIVYWGLQGLRYDDYFTSMLAQQRALLAGNSIKNHEIAHLLKKIPIDSSVK